MRWLLAVSLACKSMRSPSDQQLIERDIANFGSPDFHIFVNVYDGHGCHAGRVNGVQLVGMDALVKLPYVHLSRIEGYMTLFWKHILIPSVTRAFDIVVLKDADLLISPHAFSVKEVEYWLQRTNASIITPSIAPVRARGRAGRITVSTGQHFGAGCVAMRSPYAEQMKIARSGAFEHALWRPILSPIADAALASDSYMMHLWCILSSRILSPAPGCVHLRHVFVVHVNKKTIASSKALASSYRPESEKGQGNIVHELYRRFRWAFEEFRWDALAWRKACWSMIDEAASPTKLDKFELPTYEQAPMSKPMGDVRPGKDAIGFRGGRMNVTRREAHDAMRLGRCLLDKSCSQRLPSSWRRKARSNVTALELIKYHQVDWQHNFSQNERWGLTQGGGS